MYENRETSGMPAVKPDTRTAGEGLGVTAPNVKNSTLARSEPFLRAAEC
jgi:hypothetical protein